MIIKLELFISILRERRKEENESGASLKQAH